MKDYEDSILQICTQSEKLLVSVKEDLLFCGGREHLQILAICLGGPGVQYLFNIVLSYC